MSLGGILLYIVSNLLIAVMLGCMLFSTFVASSTRFRFAAALVAAFSLGCFFYGLQALVELGGRWELAGLYALGFVQVAQSVALAAVLVMMRLRQRAAGEHLHPRQRAEAARSSACAARWLGPIA